MFDSALIDESKDKGEREELAFSVRYYTEKGKERFLSMTSLAKFDVEAISAVTKDLMYEDSKNPTDRPSPASARMVLIKQYGRCNKRRSLHFCFVKC